MKPHEREKILSDLRLILGIDIARFVRFGSMDYSEYKIETLDGAWITVGNDDDLESFKRFKRRLRIHHGISVDPGASGVWEDVLFKLTSIQEDCPLIVSDSSRLRVSLAQYCRDFPPCEGRDVLKKAIPNGLPFIEYGKLYINFSSYDLWLKQRRDQLFKNMNEGVSMFIEADAVRETVFYDSHLGRSKVHYMKFDLDVLVPPEGSEVPERI